MRTFLITLSLASLAAFVAAGLNFPMSIGAHDGTGPAAQSHAAAEGDPWSGKSGQWSRIER